MVYRDASFHVWWFVKLTIVAYWSLCDHLPWKLVVRLNQLQEIIKPIHNFELDFSGLMSRWSWSTFLDFTKILKNWKGGWHREIWIQWVKHVCHINTWEISELLSCHCHDNLQVNMLTVLLRAIPSWCSFFFHVYRWCGTGIKWMVYSYAA